jgi:hypothetical protein
MHELGILGIPPVRRLSAKATAVQTVSFLRKDVRWTTQSLSAAGSLAL